MLSIAIVPPTANRIRAQGCQPDLDQKRLAKAVGVDLVEVENALGRKQQFRKKSTAA